VLLDNRADIKMMTLGNDTVLCLVVKGERKAVMRALSMTRGRFCVAELLWLTCSYTLLLVADKTR
jgi:hypothetical protein